MATFLSELIKKEQLSEDILAFYFKKPEGFSFIPGQHASVRLINPPQTDEEGDKRTFSMITIPTDDTVGFATRLRDTAFKTILRQAHEGMQVELIDPRGSMVLPSDTKRPIVFMTGGIGITPFMSMIRQAAHDMSNQKIFLFYSNKTVNQIPFFQELKDLQVKNSNFVFIPTITQEDTADNWQGEKGHFTSDMLKKYLPDFSNTIFYMAGPEGLVHPTMDLLTNAGVDSLFIKSEDFGEYK